MTTQKINIVRYTNDESLSKCLYCTARKPVLYGLGQQDNDPVCGDCLIEIIADDNNELFIAEEGNKRS